MNRSSNFDDVLIFLKSIDNEVKQIEDTLEEHGTPYAPGRFPEWIKK